MSNFKKKRVFNQPKKLFFSKFGFRTDCVAVHAHRDAGGDAVGSAGSEGGSTSCTRF